MWKQCLDVWVIEESHDRRGLGAWEDLDFDWGEDMFQRKRPFEVLCDIRDNRRRLTVELIESMFRTMADLQRLDVRVTRLEASRRLTGDQRVSHGQPAWWLLRGNDTR